MDLTRVAFAIGAWMVRAVETGPIVVLTVVGLKSHVAPAGRPEQVNVTGDLNPCSGVTVKVRLPVAPAATASAELLMENE